MNLHAFQWHKEIATNGSRHQAAKHTRATTDSKHEKWTEIRQGADSSQDHKHSWIVF
jgi:hypothetical protein